MPQLFHFWMKIQYGNLIGQKVGIQMARLRSGGRGFLTNILGNLTIKKRRLRKIFSNDFDHPETIFHAVFGKKCYTWSFSGDFTFRSSESGFEWREKSDCTNQRTEEWEPSSESELVDESYAVGSCSDRAILGLPPTGRLKLEDVKKAFRLSSLKWHPDKHQGPSQAMAEEKFKTCVAAYKSLCNALA
ncbi:hypothetical protein ES319_A12G096800v1 [Gossypium barbadense]|uniref:J domain-containing protein n=1 Tax=Gossypium barbadense TaxID=3634 RepID=A0A5J5T8G6_GOSBA|nr:hypothetical protein ES319_A12G096800v1 [Gossypium barbadense]KAB2052107.1 hypothetical protein ES319_A12G096800v1 [Gossypium barbadense]